MGRGQYHTASQLLEQALQSSGNAPGVQAKLGFSLMTMGQQKLGMDYLQRAFAKDPSQTRVGMALTVIHLKRGEVKPALEVAEKVARESRRA
jgi:Tfp pilus assembly protein PilF